MRLSIIFLLILTVVYFFSGCKKEEEYIAPSITITKPAALSQYYLPGKIYVELDVNSERVIKFIRASIDNANFTPIIGNRFFYPEEKTVQLAFTMDMDVILTGSYPPYYLHIALDDGIKLTHKYLEVDLVDAPLKYKGFNLITYSNKTHIVLYDSNRVEKKAIDLNGTYGDAATSTSEQLLFITTSTPAKLYAFNQERLELKWFDEPEMPYPYYTDLYEDGNYLFAGYGNERIAAFDGSSGIQKVGTPILADSVPIKISASNSYFVGYFEKRTAPKKALVSFYMATGATYKSLETDISVVDLYPSSETDVLYLIGNKDDKGIITSYFIDENLLGEMNVISAGLIGNSCQIVHDLFLISIENKVYDLVHNSNHTDLKVELPDSVVDMQYDQVNNLIYLAVAGGVYVYRYPDYAHIEFIASENPVKAIQLRYGY